MAKIWLMETASGMGSFEPIFFEKLNSNEYVFQNVHKKNQLSKHAHV